MHTHPSRSVSCNGCNVCRHVLCLNYRVPILPTLNYYYYYETYAWKNKQSQEKTIMRVCVYIYIMLDRASEVGLQ